MQEISHTTNIFRVDLGVSKEVLTFVRLTKIYSCNIMRPTVKRLVDVGSSNKGSLSEGWGTRGKVQGCGV